MIRRLKTANPAIYLSTEPVDMRKSINGLATIVEASFEMDPYSKAMFVFMGKRKDKIKILQWDKDGFALYYKRREKGKFHWPIKFEEGSVSDITSSDLSRLLEGLVMEKFLPKPRFTIT